MNPEVEKSVAAEFVGGPWDGDRRMVMAGGYGYRIPIAQAVIPFPGSEVDPAEIVPLHIHVYARRDRLTRGGYVVFEYEGFH